MDIVDQCRGPTLEDLHRNSSVAVGGPSAGRSRLSLWSRTFDCPPPPESLPKPPGLFFRDAGNVTAVAAAATCATAASAASTATIASTATAASAEDVEQSDQSSTDDDYSYTSDDHSYTATSDDHSDDRDGNSYTDSDYSDSDSGQDVIVEPGYELVQAAGPGNPALNYSDSSSYTTTDLDDSDLSQDDGSVHSDYDEVDSNSDYSDEFYDVSEEEAAQPQVGASARNNDVVIRIESSGNESGSSGVESPEPSVDSLASTESESTSSSDR